MSLNNFISSEELDLLNKLVETQNDQKIVSQEKLKKFQYFIKIRILKTLSQISNEEFEIGPNVFRVVSKNGIIGLQNMSTGRFRSIDNIIIDVNGNRLVDFLGEKLVSVEIDGVDTYFMLNSNTFITPLEGLLDEF